MSLPQPARSTGLFWEAAAGTALEPSWAPRDAFLQHQIPQPSGLGSTILAKSMPLPLSSSPINTARVVFLAQLPQISWI